MAPFVMRAPCRLCSSTVGAIEPRGGQNCVFCTCGAFQYNAPKTETGQARRTVATEHRLPASTRHRILSRANGRCERCGRAAAEPGIILHVGHALPVVEAVRLEVPDEILSCDDNLLALCEECNLDMGKEPIEPRLLVSIIKARLAWKRWRG